MRSFLIIFSFLLLPAFACAQWNSNTLVNTPVCTDTGKQNDPRVLDDGNGGIFVAWKDSRDAITKPDIYVQHMDSLGFPLWTINGVEVCAEQSDQSTPGIISDMAGGLIICWSDRRTGIDRDVFVQRLDPNGNKLWTFQGEPVAIKPQREHNEKIISDGAGGAIIAWEEQDTLTAMWNVCVQRVNSAGVRLWDPNGVPVCNVTSNRINVKLQKDGNGGAFVCWQDLRNGTDYGIYAQHFDGVGNYLWSPQGVMVSDTVDSQINPKLDPDSATSGIYVAWVDKRNYTDYNVYAQRIDSLGNKLWSTHGNPVCTAAGNQSAIDIFSNPKSNGLIVTWKDLRNGTNTDIYAQRLTPTGNPAWTMNGIVICNAIRDQLNPNITGDGNGGAIIAFQDSSTGTWNVKAQRITNTGTIVWQANGVNVGNAINDQTSPKNVSDNNGGTIVAFMDKRTFQNDVYVHKIFYDGFNVGVSSLGAEKYFTAFPNPFSDEIKLSSSLPYAQKIKVSVFNVLGQEVKELANTVDFPAGPFTVSLNTAELLPGAYFLKLEGASVLHTFVVVKN
jgi:hypothetical protein